VGYIKRLKEFISGIFSVIIEKIKALLIKVLGDENFKKMSAFYYRKKEQLSRVLFGHLEPSGAFYPLIRKIYKYTFSYSGLFFTIKDQFLVAYGRNAEY
jgi:hypothetical protein